MILIDNTVLSNFALVQHPEFIRRAYLEDVSTTHEVITELERGVALGRLPACQWTWLQKVQMTPVEQQQFHQLRSHLGPGEASCLAVAAHRKWKIATDDMDFSSCLNNKTAKLPNSCLHAILVVLQAEKATLKIGKKTRKK